jgi:transcriptional regulator with XRE-family HTH domain
MMALGDLGRGLRWLRLRKGLSLAAVAAAADCTESLVSRVERGLVQARLETLFKILEALEADWLHLGFAVRVGRGEDHGLAFGDNLTDGEIFSLAIATFTFQDCLESIANRLAGDEERR